LLTGVLTAWFLPGFVTLVLLGTAAYRARPESDAKESFHVRLACTGQAIYAGIVMLFDPFARAESDKDLMFCVMLILVPLVSLRAFVRSRAWSAVGGILLFTATCIACLFYNTP
jgi:hypothetical protein